MDVFEDLRQAVHRARRENDLPDHLAEAAFAVAAQPDRYRGAIGLVRRLVELLPDYDTYAQTGYLGMGVNDADVGMLLKAIEDEAAGRAGD